MPTTLSITLSSPPVEGCRARDGVVPSSTPPVDTAKRNARNYFSLPYNPKLRDRARELRKAGNLAEAVLWIELKNRKHLDLDFDRQKIIGNYIVDFYCPSMRLIVEIDGASHNEKIEYDTERDAYLQELGLSVLHFTDTEVKKDPCAVVMVIREWVLQNRA